MRLALMVCTVVISLAGIRAVNVNNDIVTATLLAFLAILCLWGAFTIEKIEQNEDLE